VQLELAVYPLDTFTPQLQRGSAHGALLLRGIDGSVSYPDHFVKLSAEHVLKPLERLSDQRERFQGHIYRFDVVNRVRDKLACALFHLPLAALDRRARPQQTLCGVFLEKSLVASLYVDFPTVNQVN